MTILYSAGSTANNDSWSIVQAGTYNYFLDGAGGVGTLSIGTITASQFTLTQNTNGTINLDTVSGASGSAPSHFILYNMDIISYNVLGANARGQIDLRTYFPNVIDTSANISTNLDLLQSHINTIKSITLVSPLTVTTSKDAYYAAHGQTVLDYVSATPTGIIAPLTVTATQIAKDAGILAEIIGAYKLAVTDTDANFTANLSALNASVNSISSITLTDSHVLAITTAQQTADAALLSKIVGGYTLVDNTVTLSPNSPYTAQPNQTINGTTGINKVVFSEPAANFTVSVSGSTAILVDKVGTFGTETMNNVQRAQFNDGSVIALDFQSGQNGYLTAMMIGTAFGASKVSAYFAPGVSLYDAGQTNLQIATLIEQLGLIENQIGSTNNTAWVDFVYKNVVGIAPDSVSETTFVNDLNNGTYTNATLLALAAGVADSGAGTLAAQINLVGLQTQGLSYHP